MHILLLSVVPVTWSFVGASRLTAVLGGFCGCWAVGVVCWVLAVVCCLLSALVFAGPVCWTGKKTEIGLNPTAKDRTTGFGCTNSEFFRLPVVMFVEKSKN